MSSFEDDLRSVKIRDKIGVSKTFSFVRRIVNLSLQEHDTENRISFSEKFERKPGENTDIQNADRTIRMIANPNFEVLGTNAISANITLEDGGGILFTTDGADGDGVILLPHLNTSQSPWTAVKWTTDNKLRLSTKIKTGAAITNSIIWVGFKLTNTDVIATDDDQAFIRYEDGINSGKFECVDSNTGTDNAQDSGIVVAVATEYAIVLEIDSDRVPRYYINDQLVVTGHALKSGVNLIPYVAVEADGAAEAKTLAVRYLTASRDY